MKKILAGFLAVVLAGALSGCSFGLRSDYNSVVDENEKLKAEYSALEAEKSALENKTSSNTNSSNGEYRMPKEHIKRITKVLALPESNRIGIGLWEVSIQKYNLKATMCVDVFINKGEEVEARTIVDISTNNTAQEKMAFIRYFVNVVQSGASENFIKEHNGDNYVTVVNDQKGNPIAVNLVYENNGELEYDNVAVDTDIYAVYDEIQNNISEWALSTKDFIMREITNSNETNTSTPAESTSGQTPSNTTSNSTGVAENVIRPEVKEAIDSYEAFIDEYCDFMKKMSQTDNVITMMSEYLEYMQKLSDMGEKFDKIQEGDLTNAEIAYYTEVMLRCTQKIASAAE